MSADHALVQAAERMCAVREPRWEALLDLVLTHFACPVGTLHRLDPDRVTLRLIAQRGLPDAVRERVELVPIGKGMAGIAAERRAPVQVCNLQTDTSGVVRPGAKLTQMEGSIAAPMLTGERLAGVLGVAKPSAYEFTPAESALLMEVGGVFARRLV